MNRTNVMHQEAQLAVELESLRDLDDAALVDLCLQRNEKAWREFVRRFEPALRFHVGRTLARAIRTVMASDAVEDVIGDFYVHILDGNMRKLRVWSEGGRSAPLVGWLTLLARGIAIDHWRHMFVDACATATAGDERERRDRDANRGGEWIEIERRATCEPEKKRRKRRRKSS